MFKLMDAIGRLSLVLHRIGSWIAIPALIGLISLDVTFRYLLNAPLPWGNEVASMILLLVFVAGLAHCTRERAHITMELLYERLPPSLQRASDLTSATIGLSVAVLLAWRSVRAVEEMARYGEGLEFVHFPLWPFAAFVALATIALALELFLQILLLVSGRPLPVSSQDQE